MVCALGQELTTNCEQCGRVAVFWDSNSLSTRGRIVLPSLFRTALVLDTADTNRVRQVLCRIKELGYTLCASCWPGNRTAPYLSLTAPFKTRKGTEKETEYRKIGGRESPGK